ncbi:MAG TPA: carboxypeptidase regulatory-like domain-containing protein [Pyrinomonadaceae bacterium]|nr:carboxypeptidase regulatory-like domain-containing protein [Pyrinomonadaceae bacterium]
MLKVKRTLIGLVVLAALALPLLTVRAAGGRIEGKITDQKGAAVAGATVTVTEEASNQTFSAVSDAQGQFKVENLPPGSYTVVVSAKGFGDAKRAQVKVEGTGVVTIDFHMEIAAVEASVTVPSGLKPNIDPVYLQLRQQARGDQDFSGSYATVNNVVLKREGATFTLRSGEIYFLAPVEGRMTGAVFFGDGEFTISPPTETEKNSLKIFTDTPELTEQFSTLVLRFTDKTFEQVKADPAASMQNNGPQAARARDLFRENQTLLRKELRDNRELRALADIYVPQRPGFFNAFITGKRFSKLLYVFDTLGIPQVSPEEVALFSYGSGDGGIWTAFHKASEYQRGLPSSAEDHRLVDLVKHEIDASIKGTRLVATDKVTFRALLPRTRVLFFNLYPSLRVSRVLDQDGKDLNFVQEAKDEDADFAIITAQPLEANKVYTYTVQYEGGEALRDSGGGNFILIPRDSWYPNNGGTQFGDRAVFDMTFRFPKGNTFVGTGSLVEPETRDGDSTIAKWSSGTTELAVAGFNYGRFKKKEIVDADTGYTISFYANEEVPDEIKRIQNRISQSEEAGEKTDTTLNVISTTGMADSALADAQNSTRIYNSYFGKLPYNRLAMTQQPAGFFGQAWPTLVFMPYTAFLDSTQRAQLIGTRGGTDNFWRYVAPHEIAHQWWGHTVGWDSYHDQWMSEGFAEFSASLYVQLVRKDTSKFIDFWENQRRLIVDATPATKDRKPYTVGPVTQGYRLNSAKTGGVARYLIYPKGAYILHMLRMMMYDQKQGGDANFEAMMKDFIQTHFNKDVSTEDFRSIVEKHMTKEMDVTGNGRMDWFFNEWVYGTEMPSYRFDYQINADGSLSGKITQSGVSDNFVMLVPLYADFGKGWAKLGAARIVGNNSVDITNLKMASPPKKAAICALNDVLAASIQNAGK